MRTLVLGLVLSLLFVGYLVFFDNEPVTYKYDTFIITPGPEEVYEIVTLEMPVQHRTAYKHDFNVLCPEVDILVTYYFKVIYSYPIVPDDTLKLKYEIIFDSIKVDNKIPKDNVFWTRICENTFDPEKILIDYSKVPDKDILTIAADYDNLAEDRMKKLFIQIVESNVLVQ